MDALSEVLRSVRLTGATFFSAEFTAPWGFTSPPMQAMASSLAPGTAHVVLYHLVTEGHATAKLASGGELPLEGGDVVVFPHGEAHRVWNGRTRQWRDTASDVQRALAGDLRVTRAGGRGEMTRFVCGYFGCEKHASELFLSGLPSILKIRLRTGETPDWLETAIRFLATEAASDHPGRLALLAKLSEALFVETLRRYMGALPLAATGWLAGARDPATGRALALMHRDPGRAWTLAVLAREAGVSRSTLMDRFSHFLDAAPMAYLAQWRLQLAARFLETTTRSIGEVAADVGYQSEAAFNRAFRREFGAPPGRYRRAHSDGLSS